MSDKNTSITREGTYQLATPSTEPKARRDSSTGRYIEDRIVTTQKSTGSVRVRVTTRPAKRSEG